MLCLGEVGNVGVINTCLEVESEEHKHMPGVKLESWGAQAHAWGEVGELGEHKHMPGGEVGELGSMNTCLGVCGSSEEHKHTLREAGGSGEHKHTSIPFERACQPMGVKTVQKHPQKCPSASEAPPRRQEEEEVLSMKYRARTVSVCTSGKQAGPLRST